MNHTPRRKGTAPKPAPTPFSSSLVLVDHPDVVIHQKSGVRTNAHRALYDVQITAELFRMMASGECAAHRARVKAELDKGRGASACSASIAERCGGLEELLASLCAQEAA